MPKRTLLALFAVLLSLVVAMPNAPAATKPAAGPEVMVREILVPFADLNVLLEDQPRRVLLSRQDYEELLKKAKTTPETKAPQPAAWISGEYSGTIEQERARFTGTLVVDVLEDGLHALPLDLGGVGLASAALDGKSAAIGQAKDGQLALFVEGKGRHSLVLQIVAPLQTTAATQVLQFRLPKTSASRLRMTVAGDVEVKSGLDVAAREVDAAAGVTRFELLPRGGDVSLVMTLNSHLQRIERAVVARSVVVGEVTEAYEALYATVSLAVLHQAVDRFRFVVPEGFEVTQVASPLLATWAIVPEGQRRILDVKLREPTTDTVVLNLSAVRTPARLEGWTLSKFEPLDVVGQVSVVGLLVEDRLKTESIQPDGLIAIDTAVLDAAMPEAVVRGQQGKAPLYSAVAYYAPQGEFGLKAAFRKPPAEVAVTTVLLLTLSDKAQEIRGGVAIRPEQEKLFAIDLSVPAGWHVTRVTGADDKPLAHERHDEPDKPGRLHVRLPQGVAPGTETRIHFEATSTPGGWLADWKKQTVAFPDFAVMGEYRQIGAVAVAVRDDLKVRPENEEGLLLMDEAEKKQFNLEGVPATLAYRCEDARVKLSLVVERTEPRITARTFSFVRVESGALVGHYEVLYNVEEARTRSLELLLPESTPSDVSIRDMDGPKPEYTAEVAEGMRHWRVQLAEARRGTIRLAVDFQQPVADEQPKQLAVPVVRAGGVVVYQSGIVAVEGSAELDVQVKTDARRVDIGELVDAEYQPGRRLLGAYGFVGAPAAVAVNVFRHPAYRLDPAIVQNSRLTTRLSAEGVAQTEARFDLLTKASYLEVALPADAELWSAVLGRRGGAEADPARGEELGADRGAAGGPEVGPHAARRLRSDPQHRQRCHAGRATAAARGGASGRGDRLRPAMVSDVSDQ
ncbi:MAG: hypothetical protein NTW96_00580 [Planctomycetia bacterium]|nr:hypothetical protein [Planctomycetia bacterium]